MAYVDGYVLAVRTADKERYRRFAEEVWPLFERCGALAMREWWGDDVPAGRLTDFARAVQARPDETVVFAWIEWADRAARDRGNALLQAELARSGDDGADVPVDGRRMIWGGFAGFIERVAPGADKSSTKI